MVLTTDDGDVLGNGYDMTVTASLGIVERLLQEAPEGGFYTPSLLMGADYVSELPGVSWSFSES